MAGYYARRFLRHGRTFDLHVVMGWAELRKGTAAAILCGTRLILARERRLERTFAGLCAAHKWN